jgi:dimethylaniline monooxygenase (N-oxide forming)
MAESQQFDVIVIGAGMYGIQAARTYLEIHPDAKLVILEGSGCAGGAWSKGKSSSLSSHDFALAASAG